MRRLPLTHRLLLVGLAIVQMATPALVVAADGKLASRSSMVAGQVHIEDHTGAGCHPVHPDNCALCQFLTHHVSASQGAPSAVVAIREQVPRWSAPHQNHSFARGVERSRGPPVG